MKNLFGIALLFVGASTFAQSTGTCLIRIETDAGTYDFESAALAINVDKNHHLWLKVPLTTFTTSGDSPELLAQVVDHKKGMITFMTELDPSIAAQVEEGVIKMKKKHRHGEEAVATGRNYETLDLSATIEGNQQQPIIQLAERNVMRVDFIGLNISLPTKL